MLFIVLDYLHVYYTCIYINPPASAIQNPNSEGNKLKILPYF